MNPEHEIIYCSSALYGERNGKKGYYAKRKIKIRKADADCCWTGLALKANSSCCMLLWMDSKRSDEFIQHIPSKS